MRGICCTSLNRAKEALHGRRPRRAPCRHRAACDAVKAKRLDDLLVRKAEKVAVVVAQSDEADGLPGADDPGRSAYLPG